MLNLIILALLGALTFGGLRALLAGKTTQFWLDFVSFGLAVLVILSQSFLGWHL